MDETFDEASEYLTNYLLPTSTTRAVATARATAESIAQDLNFDHRTTHHRDEEEEYDDDTFADDDYAFQQLNQTTKSNQGDSRTRTTESTHQEESTLPAGGNGDTVVVVDDDATPGDDEEAAEDHLKDAEEEGLDAEGDDGDGAPRHHVVYAEDGNVTATAEEEEPEEGEDGEEGARVAELLLEEDGDDPNADDDEQDGVQDGDEVRPVSDNDHDSRSVEAPPFALSRLKNLFKYAESQALAEAADPFVTYSLSSDAALALGEAVQLLVEDLAMAAMAEAARHHRKTVSYDDVAQMAYQLDRFAFAAEVLPLSTVPHPAPAAASNMPRSERVVSGGGKGPQAKGVGKGPSSTQAPKDGKRQQTLSFAVSKK